MDVECKKVGCNRKGFWRETNEAGEMLLCFKARHDGQGHAVKLTQDEANRFYDGEDLMLESFWPRSSDA